MKAIDCPYCKSKIDVERPFARIFKILFWYVEIPIKIWMCCCSKPCEEFFKHIVSPDRDTSGRTKKEAIYKYNAWASSVQVNRKE